MEYICPNCDGTGLDRMDKFCSCPLCKGNKKVDWVTNVVRNVDRIPKHSFVFHQKAFTTYVENHIDYFSCKEDLLNFLRDYLEEAKASHKIYQYHFVDSIRCDNRINVFIKHFRSTEIIKVTFEYNTKGE